MKSPRPTRPRAQELGWTNVIVIDDDLGRSGGGTARPGFERLLAAICTGAAGAVFAIEASRLARNGRDWHTLMDFCALVHCLIIDEDGSYDPNQVNDRLLLGMKGTFSELELSILRQRSQEARRLKAARGERSRENGVEPGRRPPRGSRRREKGWRGPATVGHCRLHQNGNMKSRPRIPIGDRHAR